MNPVGGLSFEHLPASLPQSALVKRVVEGLWQREEIKAIWLGGSLADGSGDIYSDIDLRVAVDPKHFDEWSRPQVVKALAVPAVAEHTLACEDGSVLHHVLVDSGEIIDLLILRSTSDKPELALQVLGCRDESLGKRLESLAQPAAPEHRPAQGDAMLSVLRDFWVNSHKHRKVLNRGLDLLCMIGLQYDRSKLMRLWYASITGLDCGDRRSTIFELSHLCRVVEGAMGEKAMQILGAPLTRRELIVAHIELLRNEVRDVGMELAQRLSFEYPEPLEQTVRGGWEQYLSSIKNAGQAG